MPVPEPAGQCRWGLWASLGTVAGALHTLSQASVLWALSNPGYLKALCLLCRQVSDGTQGGLRQCLGWGAGTSLMFLVSSSGSSCA